MKSSHRMTKRLCSGVLAFLLLISGSNLLASAEETASTDTSAEASSSHSFTNEGTQGEYIQYLEESGGAAYTGCLLYTSDAADE